MFKNFLITTLFFLYASIIKADTDPFSKDFFGEPPPPGDGEITSELSDENIVDENLHPLRGYDLNKYLVIGTVLELTGQKRSLAILRAPDESNHIVYIDEILSKDQPPWIIKEIDLRGITVQKDDPVELDENGIAVYPKEKIEVNNPTINISTMGNN